MFKMIKSKRLMITLSMLLLLSACGQKGDLYLPEGKSVTSTILG